MSRMRSEDAIGAKARPFTGAEYLASLRDGREIWIDGKQAAVSPLVHPIRVLPGSHAIEVKKKDALAGFVLMSGSVKSGDKRILSVDFSVAWKAPEGGS